MDRRTWMKLTAGAAGIAIVPVALSQDPPAAPDLKDRRKTQLDRLKAYAAAGKFPLNRVEAGKVTPIFFDEEAGVACAVAHLMIQDGLVEDVRKVAARNNRVRIMDVQDGPVAKWIAGSGLTQEECALIQPSYEFQRRERNEQAVALIRMHLENVHAFLSTPVQTESALAVADRRRPRSGR